MKTLVVLLFVVINLFTCNFGSVSSKPKSEGDAVVTSPTPNTNGCVEENYKHKPEAELAAMTPDQLIDEEVKEQVYLLPGSGEYWSLTHKYLRNAGVTVLPKLTEYIDAYDPKSASKCDETRFHVAFTTADHLDNMVIRLRGTKEGQKAIGALERAMQRMREAGLDNPQLGPLSFFDFSILYLKGLKATNDRDQMIMNTLQSRHKVQMTNDELLEFINFLISFDPTYPTWSEVGEYGPPQLVKESKRYYEAYLKFKSKK